MFPPPSEPPPPPPAAPAKPAAAFDDENETTHVFDKDRHALDGAPVSGAPQNQLFGGDDETTRVFDKDTHASDDENEATHVFDSDRHGPKRVPVRAGGTKIGLGVPKPPPVPSDRPAPASLKTPPPIPPPAPAEKPGLKTIRVERRSDKPQAAPAQTVIVQEHTDPAIFRQSNSIFSRAAHWVWDDPAKRGFRVGLPAGIIVFLGVFLAASGHGGKSQRATSKTAVSEVAEEARDPAPKAAQEEPRGVDPSTLPPAEDEPGPADDEDTGDRKSKARRVSRVSPPSETRVAAADPGLAPPTPAAPPPQAAAAPPPPKPPEEAPVAPAPKPPAADDIESPYAKASKPSAASPAAQKPAAKPKKSAAADCSNPFTVDADGIKRIRPECL
jgi:hypothetical protein